MQKPQVTLPAPYSKFTIKDTAALQSNKLPAQLTYRTSRAIITINGNAAEITAKPSMPMINYHEFVNDLSFNGGGCLRIITNHSQLYHRYT